MPTSAIRVSIAPGRPAAAALRERALRRRERSLQWGSRITWLPIASARVASGRSCSEETALPYGVILVVVKRNASLAE
ncbi:hypothetical protein C7S16_6758 [Burkholderia thailandensis]|uniref:Uncharacterized protein n=1 Tax=Burkholderia thailandensis TaxID=57975 RepID=A0AAW9CQS5_BURTH|nr:hypothetical protein [Burkholderia thailandensis]MDW9250954.1 hypothetical protein [Burkholderia thailandensis]